jgi:hypothetical protein
MYGKVKTLRVRGKRLSDQEIRHLEPLDGVLTLAGHQWSMEYVLTLRPRDNTVGLPLLELFQARIVVMHNDGMKFTGIERPHGDDGPAYVQDWSVMLEVR